jgi:hypothetical protein
LSRHCRCKITTESSINNLLSVIRWSLNFGHFGVTCCCCDTAWSLLILILNWSQFHWSTRKLNPSYLFVLGSSLILCKDLISSLLLEVIFFIALVRFDWISRWLHRSSCSFILSGSIQNWYHFLLSHFHWFLGNFLCHLFFCDESLFRLFTCILPHRPPSWLLSTDLKSSSSLSSWSGLSSIVSII